MRTSVPICKDCKIDMIRSGYEYFLSGNKYKPYACPVCSNKVKRVMNGFTRRKI